MRASPRGLLCGLLLALWAAALAPSSARAHQMLPSALHLQEQGAGIISVFWKVPVVKGRPLKLQVVPPEHCGVTAGPELRREGVGQRSIWRLDCGEAGLRGHAVGVEGMEATGTDAFLRIDLRGGDRIDAVLHGDAPTFRVPLRAEPAAATPAADYLSLGVEHILAGADHLLFVLGLLLVIGLKPGPLVKTITAFTAAHSLTLALAVLGVVRFPAASVEAIIALSILYLAVELSRPERAPDSLLARRPWAVAFACGLVHGLGFAGVLTGLGLPPDGAPAALLLFNVGVELGQLLFIAASATLWAALRRAGVRYDTPLRSLLIYTMGALAACWLLDRAAAVFTS